MIRGLRIETERLNEPIFNFVEGSSRQHRRWLDEVKNVWPKLEVLPAVQVRLRDTVLGHPSMWFHKSRQWHEAPAAKSIEPGRPASSQAPVEDWTFVTLPESSEAAIAMCLEFWKQQREFLEKANAVAPTKASHLLLEHLAPLCVAPQLEPENPQGEQTYHDWSI